MRQEIFKGIPDDDEKAVEAFVNHNKESALKTKPKVSVIPLQETLFATTSEHLPFAPMSIGLCVPDGSLSAFPTQDNAPIVMSACYDRTWDWCWATMPSVPSLETELPIEAIRSTISKTC